MIDGEEDISPDEIKEEVLHYSYIRSEEKTTHISSPSAQWQNTSNRKENYFKNVISGREAFKKNNDETYGKFHILGGGGVSMGSFSICYHERF